jgi:hypothetical protein
MPGQQPMAPSRQHKRTQASSLGYLHTTPQLSLSFSSNVNSAQQHVSPNQHLVCQQPPLPNVATTTSANLMSSSMNTAQFHSHAHNKADVVDSSHKGAVMGPNLLSSSCSNVLPIMTTYDPAAMGPTYMNDPSCRVSTTFENPKTNWQNSPASPTGGAIHRKPEFKLSAMP